jgi:thioredoxin-related protein
LFNAGATLENINISDEKIKIGEEELTSEEVIAKFKLQSVPVLIFERSGVEVHRLVGLRPTEEIIDAIEFACACFGKYLCRRVRLLRLDAGA